MPIYGTANNDVLNGTDSNDEISFTEGGIDTVNGLGGDDNISAGGALTAADHVNGGDGYDILYLIGNYSAGVTFATNTLVNVEEIKFSSGNNYSVTTNDNTVAAGETLKVDGSGLNTSELVFNGWAETDGSFQFYTGAGVNATLIGGQQGDFFTIGLLGNNTLIGGGGNDGFSLGSTLDANDHIDGGTGYDTLGISGDYSAGLTLSMVTNVEALSFTAGFDYAITTVDATVAAGQTLDVYGGYLVGAGDRLIFNGSAETDGSFNVSGGAGDDILVGGAGNDNLSGGAGGVDYIYGFGGDDTIDLTGQFTTADIVDGGAGQDHLAIAGDYAGGLTLGSASIVNVEGITFGGDFNYHVTALDSLVAAGATLAVDAYYLPSGKSLYFDGSAETNGSFSLNGSGGSDTLIGGAQADTFLYVRTGNDTLLGNGGDDSFLFDPASLNSADHIDGGSGTDTLILGGGDFSQLFTLGAQTLQNVEQISLGWGFDYNLKTNDANVGAGVVMTVDGRFLVAGDDVTFDGSAETNGAFHVMTGDGTDVLKGGAGADSLEGGDGADVLTGGAGADALDGGDGVDTADYQDKADAVVVTLNGGSFVTVTVGGVVEDTIKNIENVNGGSGGDTLTGDSLANVLQGGGGDDLLKGGLGADTLNGGIGVDTADYRDKTAAVAVALDGGDYASVTVGGVAEDTIKNVENVYGGSGKDVLGGDSAANGLYGGDGNDRLQGGLGADTLNGQGGVDTADYRDKTTSVAVTLNGASDVTVKVGGVAEDTIKNIENVYGGSAGDTLKGDGLDNFFNGGGGNDTLSGAAGADIFFFNTALNAATNLDHVTDFASADTIDLENDVFAALTTTGTLAADAFYSAAGATAAHDSTDRIVYNTTTGGLYYDADGAGGAASVEFAVLDNHAALTNADFVVV